jgi:hypothetical protein
VSVVLVLFLIALRGLVPDKSGNRRIPNRDPLSR